MPLFFQTFGSQEQQQVSVNVVAESHPEGCGIPKIKIPVFFFFCTRFALCFVYFCPLLKIYLAQLKQIHFQLWA